MTGTNQTEVVRSKTAVISTLELDEMCSAELGMTLHCGMPENHFHLDDSASRHVETGRH